MHVSQFFSTENRLRNLDRLWLVLLLTVAPMVIGLYYASKGIYHYGDPSFVEKIFKGEFRSLLYLQLITIVFFPPDRIGLRWPSTIAWHQTWPLVVWLAVATACWLVMRTTLPAGAVLDNTTSLKVFRSMVLAGINEEWLFRGLLTAAFCRRCGLRNGSLIVLAVFGALHAGNALLGENHYATLFQVLSATLVGSILLLATFGTQSLLIPMLVHGLYDFMVMDMRSLLRAGADPKLAIPLALAGLVLGAYCLFRVTKLEQAPSYFGQAPADQVSGSQGLPR